MSEVQLLQVWEVPEVLREMCQLIVGHIQTLQSQQSQTNVVVHKKQFKIVKAHFFDIFQQNVNTNRILLSQKGHNSRHSSASGTQEISCVFYMLSPYFQDALINCLQQVYGQLPSTYHSYCRFLGADCSIYYWTH